MFPHNVQLLKSVLRPISVMKAMVIKDRLINRPIRYWFIRHQAEGIILKSQTRLCPVKSGLRLVKP